MKGWIELSRKEPGQTPLAVHVLSADIFQIDEGMPIPGSSKSPPTYVMLRNAGYIRKLVVEESCAEVLRRIETSQLALPLPMPLPVPEGTSGAPF